MKVTCARCPGCGRIHSKGHIDYICTVCGQVMVEEKNVKVQDCSENELGFLLIGMPDSFLRQVRDERKKHGVESGMIQDLLDNRAYRKLARSAGLRTGGCPHIDRNLK